MKTPSRWNGSELAENPVKNPSVTYIRNGGGVSETKSKGESGSFALPSPPLTTHAFHYVERGSSLGVSRRA